MKYIGFISAGITFVSILALIVIIWFIKETFREVDDSLVLPEQEAW